MSLRIPMKVSNSRTISIGSSSSKKDSGSNETTETDSENLFKNSKILRFPRKSTDEFGTPNYQSVIDVQAALLDYKIFKAARTIQRVFRGWSEMCRYKELKNAVIIIQKWWRRFYDMKHLYLRSEIILQKSILEHYNKSATKIQALYRAWWSRKHLHDFYQLKSVNINTLCSLLTCLAHDLKAIKYQGLLPGVYSMRNSPCLLKAVDFLSTHGFRFHNDLIQTEWNSIRTVQAEYRRLYQKAFLYTHVPYPGHNHMNICDKINEHEPVKPRASKIDTAILRTMAKFTSSRDTYKQRRQKKFNRAWEAHQLRIQKRIMQNENFCEHLVKSMKRWRNADGTFIFPTDILKKPRCLNLILKSVNERAKPITEMVIPGCISMTSE